MRLLHTMLRVGDLDRSIDFYTNVLGLEMIAKLEGRHVFFRVGSAGVLLLFNPAETLKGDNLPSHGARGPGHAALGIPKESIEEWRRRLQDHGVVIEKEMDWPRGASRSTFGTRQGIRSNWSRLDAGGCLRGGDCQAARLMSDINSF